MKESFVGHASHVCGKRFVGGCMRRGSEWRNEGVKMKVEEKKRAFEEWLQCNSVDKYERYREKNVEAKCKVEEAKRMSNFKWGQDFDRSYEENNKKFWKEVRVRKGGLRKDANGWLLTLLRRTPIAPNSSRVPRVSAERRPSVTKDFSQKSQLA